MPRKIKIDHDDVPLLPEEVIHLEVMERFVSQSPVDFEEAGRYLDGRYSQKAIKDRERHKNRGWPRMEIPPNMRRHRISKSVAACNGILKFVSDTRSFYPLKRMSLRDARRIVYVGYVLVARDAHRKPLSLSSFDRVPYHIKQPGFGRWWACSIAFDPDFGGLAHWREVLELAVAVVAASQLNDSSSIASAEVAPSDSVAPPAMLRGWRAVLDALGLDESRANRDQVKTLNGEFGPIRWAGRRPVVSKHELLNWVQDAQRRSDELAASGANEKRTKAEMDERGNARLGDLRMHVVKSMTARRSGKRDK